MFNKITNNIKKFWNWIWNSDSILSWIVALLLVYLFVKLIFFPTLSLVTGSTLPLAGVESSSMDHQIVKDDYKRLTLCDKIYSYSEKQHINFDEYWEVCGSWYEKEDISKEIFSNFPLKNGFRKGDIIIVWGRFTPKIGDIIIFKPNPESKAPRPIIHRIVSIENKNNEKIFQTKGDHNPNQLIASNNIYNTDETTIKQEQIIGKAILKIPYLGWFKIIIVEFFNKLF